MNPFFSQLALGLRRSLISKQYINQQSWRSSRALALSSSNPNTNKIIKIVQDRASELNNYYEKVTGIADIRQIQDKVISAEQEFVEISQKRKSYQDKIDNLKNSVRSLKDKLDSTSPTSDSYLELRKYEYDLSRELLTLDAQLARLKEKEQLSFDGLSKLLRQNHEQERLRQERAKHWQVISIALSTVVSLVALITQRIRSQTQVVRRLDSVESSLCELRLLKEDVANTTQTLDCIRMNIATLLKAVIELQESVNNKKFVKHKDETAVASKYHGWLYYIPGSSMFSSLFRMIF